MRLLLVTLFLSLLGKAQIDSAITLPILGIHLGGQVPSLDMAKRFGPNLDVGGTFMIKTKKNWLFGAAFTYMFGRNVKENVLTQLKNADGFVLDNEGFPADLRVTERGMRIQLYMGRVFKLASANPNSGLMVHIGGGYMQHKIKLYDAQQKIAAVKGDRVYGLDRLSNGFMISEFVGYLFISENRLLNFYAGFEFSQAFTTSVRKFNYDTGLPDTKKRVDVLTGLQLGWILPLYKKKPNEFYYD